MFKTKEEAEYRVNNSSLIVKRHRGEGKTPNKPVELRAVLGALTEISGPKAVKDTFGWNMVSMNNYRHGKSAQDYPPVFKDKVDAMVGAAQEKAAQKLLEALGLITPEKLEDCKAKDLSSVAADMSRIIEKTRGNTQASTNQIIIYAPRTSDEDKFDVVVS